MLIDYNSHKIFAFSDTHGMYLRLKVPVDADVLICAGDACEGFNPADLQDFFTWYASIPARLRIFVPGNHDRIINSDPVRARNMVPGSIVLLELEGLGEVLVSRFLQREIQVLQIQRRLHGRLGFA